MMRIFKYLLILILVSCGSQKEFSGISDKIAEDYLQPTSGSVLINQPLYESVLKAIKDKYDFYKDYNSSPIYPHAGDTLKYIFSEKNVESFKKQLSKQTHWAKKSYIKQTIIDVKDKSQRYHNKTIFLLSYPVITLNKKYAVMQSSSYHRRSMVGSDELLIFKKQKNKWVIYKRYELSLY